MGRLKAVPARLSAAAPKLRAAPKVAEPFYQSRAWRELVDQVKRKRGRFCERCGAGGRLIADHKIERKDGGADLDEANIELLCARVCHPRKTAAARARRARGGV
jgi:ribosomal protein S27AE